MLLNDVYEVYIEKMLNEGYGLARVNNLPVFVPSSCVGDKLLVKITRLNKRYAYAEIQEIIESSKFRVKALCPLSKVCGSCDWLHIDYSEQLRQKQNIVKETLKKITGICFNVNDTISSPKISEYRCKVQYPVTQKKSGRLISGYYKKGSHEIVNVKYCPMHNSKINEIMEFIKEAGIEFGITGYNEKSNTGLLRHIVFREASFDNKLLIIFVINSNKILKELEKFSDVLIQKFPMITGICVNFNDKKTNVILGKQTKVVLGNDFYIEQLNDIKYKISASSFFQVNPLCAQRIFDVVKNLIVERFDSPTILDAYSGVSSFGIWFSKIAKKVVSIEESVSASNDAIENLKLNKCNNVEIINGDAGKCFEKLISANVKFDVSLIDPPRKGSSEEALYNLISLTNKYIVYVSCNVATLARDMNILMQNGFNPTFIQPVDMFPNTYHVETIVLFERKE